MVNTIFCSMLQRYDEYRYEPNFFHEFVRFCCDTTQFSRQSGENAPKFVAIQAYLDTKFLGK
jgi:hypothetical protein